jgi:hypothetical protein
LPASAIGNTAPAAKVAELDFSKSRREIRKVPSNALSPQPAPFAGFCDVPACPRSGRYARAAPQS